MVPALQTYTVRFEKSFSSSFSAHTPMAFEALKKQHCFSEPKGAVILKQHFNIASARCARSVGVEVRVSFIGVTEQPAR